MKTYYRVIGGVLAITALGKLASVFAPDPVMDTWDPVSGLVFRHLFILAASIEMAVALILFRSSNDRALAYVTATAATLFLSYRVASLLAGGEDRCPCLGALTGMLPVSERVVSNLLLGFIALMLFPSIVVIVRLEAPKEPPEKHALP